VIYMMGWVGDPETKRLISGEPDPNVEPEFEPNLNLNWKK